MRRAIAPAAAKTVTYAGYELRVPASWPEYRLDENPGTCVRYDMPAVYLGTPGANQCCPARLLGRTETVSPIPTYVGPQAPCYGYGVLINPKRAASQGKAAVGDAVGDAQLLGLPPGSPVYGTTLNIDGDLAGGPLAR